MRQLIARIDEDLHARLKRRAAADGVSLNALVTCLLADAVAGDDDRSRLARRLEATGRRVLPPAPPAGPPSRDAAVAATRGAGSAASEAVAAERSAAR